MFSAFRKILFALTLGTATVIPGFTNGNSHALPRAISKVGYIDVAVATLWTTSRKPRTIDKPALLNPVELEKWLHSMNLTQYRDLTNNDRTQTQALYGTKVFIIDYQSGWYEIATSGQPTPKNKLGYPGWVPAAQVSLDTGYGELQENEEFAIVNKVATTILYRDAALKHKFIEISFDTRLPLIGKSRGILQVTVPSGGSAYLSSHDATVYSSTSEIPYPEPQDLVDTANLFLDRPYLWGGASGLAFDCSGLTHTLYHAHGITIARDSDAQADFTGHGRQVVKSDLQPADLIFYATNQSDPSTIYHVAMYVGDGKMVEAYKAGVPVRITPVRFTSDYWGAKRFLE